MIETLFVASLAASIAAFAYLRLRALPERRQALFRGLLELTVPLTMTSGVFAVLQWRVRSIADEVTAVSSIREIEFAIRWIRNARIERLLIPGWMQFAIIAGLVIVGLFGPNLRTATLLAGFKRTARWMTRIQIVATLFASFTFFGAVQATNAHNAEVRLGEDISAIERSYDSAFAAAAEAVAARAAAVLVEEPRWQPAFEELAEALKNEESADAEITRARAVIVRESGSELRDFEVAADRAPRHAKVVDFLPRKDMEDLPRRETWTAAESQRHSREAEALRREAMTELVTAAADAGRQALAKRLVAEYFAGSAAEGFAAVVLDASVFYDFRHHVAAATAALVERVLIRGDSMRAALLHVQAALQAKVSRLAPAAARQAETIYANNAAEARVKLADAQEIARTTLDEYRTAANAQAAREQAVLVERFTQHLRGEMKLAAEMLIQGLVERRGEPAMTRIGRIRALSSELWSPYQALPLLTAKEQQRGGPKPLNAAIEAEVHRLLATESYSRAGWQSAAVTSALSTSEVEDAWQQEKRAFVLSKIAQGATSISASEWEGAKNRVRSGGIHPSGTDSISKKTKPKPKPKAGK